MSGTWNDLSISDITAQAAAKARAVNTNLPTSSPPDGGAGVLPAKRESSQVAFAERPSTRQRTAGPSTRSTGASPVATPEPPAADGDVTEVPSKPLSVASVAAAPTTPEYDPVAAGAIPHNMIFGHYGTLSTNLLMSVKHEGLMDLAVVLNIFPDVGSIPAKLSAPSLRHLIASATGTVGDWTFDDTYKVFNFSGGVTVEQPLFHRPATA